MNSEFESHSTPKRVDGIMVASVFISEYYVLSPECFILNLIFFSDCYWFLSDWLALGLSLLR